MIALVWKEVRGLQAFLVAVLVLLAAGYVYSLLIDFPDMHPFTPGNIIEEAGPSITMALLGLILGIGLLLREHHDRTLLFLDALPLTRSSVFVAKFMAGLVVLIVAVTFQLSIEGIFGWLSRTSTDAPFPTRFLLVLFGLLCVTGAYTLSLSLVLSFLRRWSALVLGLVIWGSLWLSSQGHMWPKLLSPFHLVPQMKDDVVHVPWQMLWVQVGIAVGATIFAWFCFLHLGMRTEDLGRKFFGRRWKAILGLIVTVATPLVWLGVLTTINGKLKDEESGSAKVLKEDAFAERRTSYYHFLFRESQRALAEELMSQADDVYYEVWEHFGGVDFPAHIIVDLASPVPSHTAGATNWTRLRIPIWEEQPADRLFEILAHETAHAFQHRAGGIRYLHESRWIRFFNEGLASHIGLESYGSEEEVQRWDRLAAAAVSRGAVSWRQLSDDDELSKHRDPALVYPLGLAFCRGLERIGGAEVFSNVIAAFPDLPKGRNWDGGELWRHVCDKAGIDLNRAIAAYDEELEKLAKEHADFVGRLPRLTGAVATEGDHIVIRAQYSGKSPGSIVCNIDGDDIFGGADGWFHADNEGVIMIPRKKLRGESLRYMLGWALKETRWPVFEPWVEAGLF